MADPSPSPSAVHLAVLAPLADPSAALAAAPPLSLPSDTAAHQDELRLEGRRYALVTAMHRDYPLPETLRALEAAGVPRETALGDHEPRRLRRSAQRLARLASRAAVSL